MSNTDALTINPFRIMLRNAMTFTHDLVDRPSSALITTGGGLGVGLLAKWAAHAGECAAIIAPFAMLAGYLTTFCICIWWVVKWIRTIRAKRWPGDDGHEV